MSDLQRELTVAVHAARSAGSIVKHYFDAGVEAWEKSKNNPVTHADLEANQRIQSLISEAFPDDGWLSEENADSAERLSKKRVWIVDPLDGTKEFIDHIPEFCVCIGLTIDGRAVLGAEYNPATD